MTSYTLYIDESGEEGVNKIRTPNAPGASPWLCFGAFLINDSDYDTLNSLIHELEQDLNISSGLHFKNLRHKQRVYACTKLAHINATFFGTLSNKLSTTSGVYIEQIEQDAWKYYNKNAQYLLELVGHYFYKNHIGINDHKIIFENKRGVRYESLKNLLRKISENPIRQQLKNIQYINPSKITTKGKSEENLLKIADFIASSLFQCCENNNFGITETRYLHEMRNKFFCAPNGKIIEYGIKAINCPSDLHIKNEDRLFLSHLKAETSSPRCAVTSQR